MLPIGIVVVAYLVSWHLTGVFKQGVLVAVHGLDVNGCSESVWTTATTLGCQQNT